MYKNFNKRQRDNYWNIFSPNVNAGDLIYHAAGADRKIDLDTIKNKELLPLWYRFVFEDAVLSRLVSKYVVVKQGALDCGFGTGRSISFLHKNFEHVTAFDISSTFYTSAKIRYKDFANISFYNTGFDSFETSEKYDLIFIGGVFMYMDEREVKQALKKVQGWLSPDGILICRDTLSKSSECTVENIKAYRSIKQYKELFTDFKQLEKINGANRNILCSFFLRLPDKLQEHNSVFTFFKKVIQLFIIVDILLVALRGAKRHPLANQMYYAFTTE